MTVKNKLYPHLMPVEILVWEKWILQHGDRYDRYVYDVRVGESYEYPDDTDPVIKEMGILLGKKRIDVVAWTGRDATLIEVCPLGTTRQIGQLVTYTILFADVWAHVENINLLLVAHRLQPDIAHVCDMLGIWYDIV